MHEPGAVRFSRRIVGLQTAVLRVSLKSYYRFETGIPHELCRIAHARGDAQGQSGGSSQDVEPIWRCDNRIDVQGTDSFMLDTGDGQAMALPVDDA
ncbi:hypothetical protein NP493_628g01016 [Ridgeia piscesae]|uniref:Uncharacterized protein n=1 Tax=Ridgeia piscesae TaxID=27915 RepID=A0AAD9N995_RIDPI|nr:hypothetical protein NP493_1772g00011 [Ridgeia piscesae]KAK2176952.1 hypothetical protein NP493_628g01016 [Ridgeia piscesae]